MTETKTSLPKFKLPKVLEPQNVEEYHRLVFVKRWHEKSALAISDRRDRMRHNAIAAKIQVELDYGQR